MTGFVPYDGSSVSVLSADPGETFPFLHTITVVDRVVSVDKPELVQNNIRTETVTLDLDSEWDGLSVTINIGNEKPAAVLWSGTPVVIPAEVMTTVGSLDVSVVGYSADGQVRAVTKQAKSIFNVVASGFVEGEEVIDDPPTLLGQLLSAADRANQAAEKAENFDVKGVDVSMLPSGSSASGSFENSVISLSIPKGDTGPEGPVGPAATIRVGKVTTGAAGSSASVVNSGTSTDVVLDFTIPRGDKGAPGSGDGIGAITTDATLTGDGTSDTPLGVASGTAINPTMYNYGGTIDFNDIRSFGFYDIRVSGAVNAPFSGGLYGFMIVAPAGSSTGSQPWCAQILVTFNIGRRSNDVYCREYSGSWNPWFVLIPATSTQSVQSVYYQALETRVQALESQVAQLQSN